MKGSTLAFSMNMHFSNLFYSILDLFVLINTPWNRTSVNLNVELWSIQGGADFFFTYTAQKIKYCQGVFV